jgi:hypothetical protein
MNLTAVWILSSVAMAAILHIVWSIKYRNLPIETWIPGAAWCRAFMYFAFCNIVIAASGTLEQVFTQPIFTLEQTGNTIWLAYFLFCFAYVFVAYWILWARMTLTFNRRFYLGSGLLFGLAWGWSTGGLLLSFYHMWSLAGVPGWATYLLAFASMGLWQYASQDYFWDVYVSPEHDTPRSIIIKTAVCHVPNVAICLGFLVLFNNYAIYVALQTSALIASTIFQKMPAPWAKGSFHAPMNKTGIWGLPHGAGYTADDI